MSENAASRLARLLALVPWLKNNDGVTINEAAQHFDVTPEQLTTDLWQLIVCGIPGYGPDQLLDIQFWDDERIHVLDPITLDRPLRLTGEEAASLVVALRVLAQIPGDHDRSALRSAIGKLQAASASTPDVDIQIDADPAVFDALSAAIGNEGGLEIEYASATSDSFTRRRIAPRASYTVDGHIYVEAWCELAEDIRTFRTDRIVSATPVPQAPGPESNAQSATPPVASGPALPADAPVARIAVNPDAAWIWDSDPVTADGLATDQTPDGRAWPTGTLTYASEGYLLRFCLGRAGQVILMEPAALRSELTRQAQERAARLRARQGASG